MSTKEQYWKYSLITIIIGLGIILFRQITPFLGGLLGALTIYILVRRQMIYLSEKRKMKRSIAATIITAEAILCFLVPLALVVWLAVINLQNINLDPDEVRVTEKGNPALEGDYTLWLPAQPSTITVMGLISSPGKKPFTPGRDVASYLDEQSLLSGADNSYAWVIYPDGNTQKAPVAYWNKRHVEPMPGSIIFVGFADHFWTKAYDGLNADILRSLIQRIPE